MDKLQSIGGGAVADVLAVIRSLGWGAIKILRAYYRGEPGKNGQALALEIQNQTDGPVTAADLAVNQYILSKLESIFGTEQFGYLSEETYKTSSSTVPLPQDWVWILDPLDGTRDFIDRTGEYAFHLALTHRGRPILAVVACPEVNRLYYASLGGGAFVEQSDRTSLPLSVSLNQQLADLTVVTSRTHRDQRFNRLLQQLACQRQLAVGSVGGKIAAIVEKRADVYLSMSGKSAPKDWDMAAPELILTEAGGRFTQLDGTALQYNTGDVSQWGCLVASNGVCHAELCDQIQAALAAIDQVSDSAATKPA